MRIAFISYEYPTETGGGGIGTYLSQIVTHLPQLGHSIIVFCGTHKTEAWWQNDYVRRVPCANMRDFNTQVVHEFSHMQHEMPFDIIEGTDFMSWGYLVHQKFPEIPFVVRAHSNSYIVDKFLYEPLTGLKKLRFALGAFKKLQLPLIPSAPKPENYRVDVACLKDNNAVISPSHALGKLYQQLAWVKTYKYLPYIFDAPKSLLSLNFNAQENLKIVFYGRLEVRKGVLELAKIIPHLLSIYHHISFHFYGSSANAPNSKLTMQQYLEKKLSKFKTKCVFHGKFEPEKLPAILNEADIILIPSRFDNSPLACYESMAAGKAIIASKFGGMAELITHDKNGILINPFDANDFREQLAKLIEDKTLRKNLGQEARKTIIENYNQNNILNQQIAIYQNVIHEHRKSPFN